MGVMYITESTLTHLPYATVDLNPMPVEFVWPLGSLKGQYHEIFDFRFSTWISFPQAPDYIRRAVSNFSKIR